MMDFVRALFALDVATLVGVYGNWIFAILFFVIFAETGLVVFPFLPGDSLLFVAGTVAATGGMHVHLLALLLCVAAIVGNTVNYSVGRFIGPRVFSRAGTKGAWKLIRKSHLDSAHEFFEKHGAVALVIGRFVPIVRTFVPFLAGVSGMSYAKYMLFNVIGSVAWIGLLVYAGYLFGNVPLVKNNFSVVIVAIVVISVLPMAVQFGREWLRSRGARRR